MNELVQLIQQKTGLSQDQAQQVVNTVVGFLKAKLPGPLASGLDDVLGSSASGAAAGTTGGTGGVVGAAAAVVEDFFGKKKNA
jgi:hypothetical protein